MRLAASILLCVFAGAVGLSGCKAGVPTKASTAVRQSQGATVAGKVLAGEGVTSNNGGSLLSEVANGLLSEASAGIVAEKGAGYRALAVAEQPLAQTAVFLADAAGNPIPGTVLVHTDAAGNFAIPQVPPGHTYRVVALVTTGAGKTGRLEALAAPDVAGTVTGIGMASTLVTALATEGRTGTLGAFDPESYAAATRAAGRAIAPHDLPDLASPAAVLATAKGLAAQIAELRDAVGKLNTRLAKAEADIATLKAEVEALKKQAGVPGPAPAVPALLEQASWVATLAGDSRGHANGSLREALFDRPTGVAYGPGGAVFVTDGSATIRRIGADGHVATLASAKLASDVTEADPTPSYDLQGLAYDAPRGLLYASDYEQGRVYRVEVATGALTVLAGGGEHGWANGQGVAARFSGPTGIGVDAAGNVYVAEYYNNDVRKVTPGGLVTTLAGHPEGFGYFDGAGDEVQFRVLNGLGVGPDGRVYVADTENSCIRVIDPKGAVATVRTLAGKPEPGFADGLGGSARFAGPTGLVVDGAGNVYVADTGNQRLRRIDPAGVVTTVAGTGEAGSQDGPPAEAAFDSPAQLAIDANGRLLVADTVNHRIRVVTVNAGH